MRAFITISIALTLAFSSSFAQTGKNKEFFQSKGRWKVPVNSYRSAFDNLGLPYRGEGISFLTDSLYEIHAVYKGEVVAVVNADTESYSVTTRYGDYFITYDNLFKPSLQKGDLVAEGQVIGRIYGDQNETNPSFTIILQLKEKSLPLAKWFNWEKQHITERL